MNEIKKKLSIKLIEFIDKNSLWDIALCLFVFTIVCMAAGAVTFWLWKRHKIKAETIKLLKETEKISLELVEKKLSFIQELQPYKDKYRNHFELLNLSLRATAEAALNKYIQELDANREETIRIFCTDLVPSFVDYSEIAMSINNREENKFFLTNEVIPFLELAIKFIETVNMNFILSIVNKAKMNIRRETLISLYHIVEPNMKPYWIKLQCSYKNSKKQLQMAQQACEPDGKSLLLFKD